MLKQALKKYYNEFSTNKYIAKFSKKFASENIWAFNRNSVTKACAVGIACSWIPLPFHTVIAVAIAVIIDCNIPVTAIAIWAANPLTMPFMYYFAYELGVKILQVHNVNLHFHLAMNDILHVLHLIWEPFILGLLICSLVTGLVAYVIANVLWRCFKDKWSN